MPSFDVFQCEPFLRVEIVKLQVGVILVSLLVLVTLYLTFHGPDIVVVLVMLHLAVKYTDIRSDLFELVDVVVVHLLFAHALLFLEATRLLAVVETWLLQ